MPKRGKGKVTHHKRRVTKAELEEKLIHNMVELQKVYADTAVKFDSLTKEISSLLKLFESAAKAFADQSAGKPETDKEFLDKIDRLLDQNKTIAKGLMLMEDRMREKVYGVVPQREMPREMPKEEMQPSMGSISSSPANRPLPRF